MRQVIDYLAQEEAKATRRTITVKDSTKARKAHKAERMKAMLNDLLTAQPQPVVDYLAFGD